MRFVEKALYMPSEQLAAWLPDGGSLDDVTALVEPALFSAMDDADWLKLGAAASLGRVASELARRGNAAWTKYVDVLHMRAVERAAALSETVDALAFVARVLPDGRTNLVLLDSLGGLAACVSKSAERRHQLPAVQRACRDVLPDVVAMLSADGVPAANVASALVLLDAFADRRESVDVLMSMGVVRTLAFRWGSSHAGFDPAGALLLKCIAVSPVAQQFVTSVDVVVHRVAEQFVTSVDVVAQRVAQQRGLGPVDSVLWSLQLAALHRDQAMVVGALAALDAALRSGTNKPVLAISRALALHPRLVQAVGNSSTLREGVLRALMEASQLLGKDEDDVAARAAVKRVVAMVSGGGVD